MLHCVVEDEVFGAVAVELVVDGLAVLAATALLGAVVPVVHAGEGVPLEAVSTLPVVEVLVIVECLLVFCCLGYEQP